MPQCGAIRRVTKMARKLISCSSSSETKSSPTTTTPTTNETKRCMRPGPVQRNPFLNFLREYRKTHCGLSVTETVRQGAQAWKSLSKEEKTRFIVEAFYAPRRRRRKLSGGVRNRLATSRKSASRKRRVRGARMC